MRRRLHPPHAAMYALLVRLLDPYTFLLMGLMLAVAWAWGDIAALPTAGEARTGLARVWFTRELPLLAALRLRIEAGPEALCAWADEAV